MARNSIIKAIITADTKGFDKAIGQTDTSLASFGKKAGVAGLAIAGGIGAAVAVTKPLIDAASNWQESASRVDTIFGEASESVRAFADTSADTFAVSGTEALTAAGNFAGFFDSLGGDELADMSTDLVAAAADFASFNNLSTDEALSKFNSTLAGSSEVMRAYGIDTSAAAVTAKALEMGLGKANGELTEQEKNLARSAILLDESNTFMGDFERTSGSLANQQKELSAKFADVQVALGEKLLPVAVKVAEIAVDLIDGFSGVIDVFSEDGLAGVLDMVSEKFEAFDKVREIVGYIAEYIIEQVSLIISIFDGLIDFVRAVFTGQWGDAWEAVKQIFEGVWDYIGNVIRFGWDYLKLMVETIIAGVKLLWDWSFLSKWVSTAIDGVVTFFGNIPGRLGGFFGAIADVIKAPFISAFNAVKSFWNSTVGGFGFTTPGWLPFGAGNKSFHIPEMAAGGIVTSPTLALIGEAGPEAVIPLGSSRAGGMMGGGQMVHVTLEVDGRVLAQVVADANRDSGMAFT